MPVSLAGRVTDQHGLGLNGVMVRAILNGSTNPTASTTTTDDSEGQPGYWSFADLDDGLYNIRVEAMGKVHYIYGPSEVQLNRITIGAGAVELGSDGVVKALRVELVSSALGQGSVQFDNPFGDPSNAFEIRGLGDELHLTAYSEPGAVEGAGIVFATGEAGDFAWDRMWLHPSGGLSLGNSIDPGEGSLQVKNDIRTATLTFGLVPATQGTIRLSYGNDIWGRNLANDGDVRLIHWEGKLKFPAGISLANQTIEDVFAIQQFDPSKWKLDNNGNLTLGGSATITGQLHFPSVADVGLGGGGALIIGSLSSLNLAMDNNEIIARDNGAAATLFLNNDGGIVSVGPDGIQANGPIRSTELQQVGNSGGLNQILSDGTYWRIRSRYDHLIIQGGINDSNPRGVHIRSGDSNYGIYITTTGGVTVGGIADPGAGNLRVSGYIDFPNTVTDKIHLYSTTYGLGINSGELALWSSGKVAFRNASRSGTVYGYFDGTGLNLTGKLELSGTILMTGSGTYLEGGLIAATDQVTMPRSTNANQIFNKLNGSGNFYWRRVTNPKDLVTGAYDLMVLDNNGKLFLRDTTIGVISDERAKTNVKSLSKVLERVRQARPVSFNPVDRPTETRYGVIAQEVEAVFPEVVEEVEFIDGHDGADYTRTRYKTVNYGALIPILFQAVKELDARLTAAGL